MLFVGSAVLAQDGRSQKLSDGFDASEFSPEGGLYYRDNAEQASGRYEFQNEIKRNGSGALKLTVNPLCDPGDDECSERAEIWEKTPLRVPYDQGVWYGFAMKMASPIPKDDHRYLMAQWKREIGPEAEGDFSPYLALRLDKGKMFFTIETNFLPGGPASESGKCPAGTTPVWFRPETRQMRALASAGTDWTEGDASAFPDCTDKISVVSHNPLPTVSTDWVDFAIYSHPDPDGKGRIEIFADKVWIATVKGHIGHGDHGLGKNQYFKFGPYRAGASDIWTVYYDDFRRSPDCVDVLGDEKACAALN
ncbi:MAG: polysaccharide lyase [Rhizobium sp.]|nr:polysaccharide lyase [Rhizobium sp.]